MDTSLLATDKIFLQPRLVIAPSQDILQSALRREFFWDVELSNRCNAQCYFCPRDVLSKFGNMSLETIKHVIDRIADISPPGTIIGACGHGEPLLNPHIVDFIRYGTERGFRMGMVSNGAQLKFVSPESLIDAGLYGVIFSISEIGDTYTEMYKLPFEDVLDGVRRFRDYARGRCKISINLVITEKTRPRVKALKEFWRKEGITEFDHFPVINRGGDVPGKNERYLHSPFRVKAERIMRDNGFTNLCWRSVFLPFIGWDGYYYLCCNDWSKRHRIGHVTEMSLQDLLEKRIELMNDSESLCKTCDVNLRNRIVDCYESDPRAETTLIPTLLEDRRSEEKSLHTYLASIL